LSTTQSRLSTGKKVNTALDNPTNFFTAQGLDNRATDINNLLDGISNGVQVLQSANTGITSLQKLVDSAKSVANQALQASVGYSSKSTFSTTAEPSASAADLRGLARTSTAVVGTQMFTDATTAPGTTSITGATKLSGTAGATSDNLATAVSTSDTLTVNGTTISFVASGATGNQLNITDDVSALITKINSISGGSATAVAGGKITLNSGATSDLVLGGSVLAKVGLTAGTTVRATGTGVGILDGKTLTIGATGNGKATNITFGDGTAGTVKSLNDLNTKLADNNLQASLDSTGKITITTTNDAASSTIGTIGGTAVSTTGSPFASSTVAAPVQDPAALVIRANLVSQYNNILDQITSTAQDSSYNGVNLLNGDNLKLTFNETGRSTLNIQGVAFNSTGLGLSKLTAGTDFLDNASATKAITTLGTASSSLRTQASSLGSNLSVVQIRQDFSKNLINVLQTGSSNLTLADTNEEAANSQALSTRQSIAVSALSLANQSQQSVLQLLR
ncbi:MAG: flagellar protein, partial [Tardiphaga sp.]|nr:flagellar protein [Tardiphaga sp.]